MTKKIATLHSVLVTCHPPCLRSQASNLSRFHQVALTILNALNGIYRAGSLDLRNFSNSASPDNWWLQTRHTHGATHT